MVGPRAQLHEALHRRPTQVQIAVLHPQLLRGIELVEHLEGQPLGVGQDLDRLDQDFHLAGVAVFVLLSGDPRTDGAGDLNHVLGVQRVQRGTGLGGRILVGDQLHQPCTVTQVDEEDSPVVTAIRRPTAQLDLLADVLCAQVSAPMRPPRSGRAHRRRARRSRIRARRRAIWARTRSISAWVSSIRPRARSTAARARSRSISSGFSAERVNTVTTLFRT